MAIHTNLLRSISPLNNSKDIPLDTSIYISFNRAMNEETLNLNTIYIYSINYGKVPANYEYDNSNRQLVISPIQPLQVSTRYLIRTEDRELGPKTITGDLFTNTPELNFTTNNIPIEVETEEPDTSEPVVPTEDDSEETPPGPIFDSNALKVITSYPDNNHLWDSRQPIAIQFSHTISEPELDKIILRIKPISSLFENSEYINTTKNLSEDKHIVYITPLEEIKSGEEFQIIIHKEMKGDNSKPIGYNHEIDILSNYDFFFIDVESLKLVAGDFASDFTDIQLAHLIGQVSESLNTQLMQIGIHEGQDYTIITGTIPYGAREYVLYSVMYQMVLSTSLMNSSGIKKNIRLGDLSVENASNTTSTLPDLLKLLKEEIDKWWAILLNRNLELEEGETDWYRQSSSSVRGLTEYPYPDFQTRVPFNPLGGNV